MVWGDGGVRSESVMQLPDISDLVSTMVCSLNNQADIAPRSNKFFVSDYYQQVSPDRPSTVHSRHFYTKAVAVQGEPDLAIVTESVRRKPGEER